jgi:hypothetical protein
VGEEAKVEMGIGTHGINCLEKGYGLEVMRLWGLGAWKALDLSLKIWFQSSDLLYHFGQNTTFFGEVGGPE